MKGFERAISSESPFFGRFWKTSWPSNAFENFKHWIGTEFYGVKDRQLSAEEFINLRFKIEQTGETCMQLHREGNFFLAVAPLHGNTRDPKELYHVTPSRNVTSIEEHGLDWRRRIGTTERLDCIGNTYVAEHLGQTGDDGTAFKWLDLLKRAQPEVPNWSILRVPICEPIQFVVIDPFAEIGSGLIIRHEDPIRDCKVVYNENEVA